MRAERDPNDYSRFAFFPDGHPPSVRKHLPVHLPAFDVHADRFGTGQSCRQRTVLAMVLVVPLLLLVLGSCTADPITSITTPRPPEGAGPTPAWREVIGEIRSASTLVIYAMHEPERDFVRIVVPDGTNVATARSLGCVTVQRILTEANAFAFFAIYSESGRILSSWSACR